MKEEEEEHLFEIRSKSSFRSRPDESDPSLCASITNILIPTALSLIQLAYLSLFLILFIPSIPFTHNLITAINPKAFAIDWQFCLQFSLFSFVLLCSIISFILIHCTKGTEIPEDPIWLMQTSKTNSPQQKIEQIALQFIQREESLNQNNNQLNAFSYQSEDSVIQGNTTCSSNSVAYNDYITINERKSNNKIRYCKKCNKFKPDRAHHCNKCNKCYLKLDHHSVWFNKCIAYSNYKFYVTFLFYKWNICLLFLIKLFPYFGLLFQYEQRLRELICFSIIYSFTIGLFCLTFFHWRYHMSLVINNLTSIEYRRFRHEEEEIKVNAHTNGVSYSEIDPCYISEKYYTMKYVSKYYISMWYNWTELFGDNIFLWFIPARSKGKASEINEGIKFKVNHLYSTEIIKSF